MGEKPGESLTVSKRHGESTETGLEDELRSDVNIRDFFMLKQGTF